MGNIKICLFGAALATILKQTKTTQYALAQSTGLTEDYINKLIHDKREPRATTMLRIGRALPVPPGDLLNEMDRLTREYEETGVLPAIVQEVAARTAAKIKQMEEAKARRVLFSL